MKHVSLNARDIKIFSDAASAFFRQTTGIDALVRTAYMLDGSDSAMRGDFKGIIELGGKFRGSVTFSASRGLLSHVLLLVGESDYSDASHRDIVGEIANQMTGYARRHFGEALDMSPPRVVADKEPMPALPQEGTQFVIPLTWDRYESNLSVHMVCV
ncbi:chemotaxis protein CheX [Rhodoferax sp.]|uniref:chemotaxis protein CheX n=1 Tax=Rhodoferax sp. TaxID=50421 RepID=UPI0026083717|nr:chemotaxis protein CheX [Rhodoferax sp.]MDD2808769.1 chemotaxis protein CheX [Rhodoferax sp.]MDD4944593.1 chemotaxis protein CheX [Rhodoferax sp.]